MAECNDYASPRHYSQVFTCLHAGRSSLACNAMHEAGSLWKAPKESHRNDARECFLLSEVHVMDQSSKRHPSQRRGSRSVASPFAQLVTSCIGLADRIRPPSSFFSELHVPRYPRYCGTTARGGFPRRRSGHVPLPPQARDGGRSLGVQPSQPSSRQPWFFFSTLIRTRPSRDRPKAADPSHPVQNFPPALSSSHPSTPSAPAFACLDRLPFDVNRIGTRLFLMTLSFLSF